MIRWRGDHRLRTVWDAESSQDPDEPQGAKTFDAQPTVPGFSPSKRREEKTDVPGMATEVRPMAGTEARNSRG